jgi:glycosyltransferase involved in cell wall biosynthesis
MRRVRMSRYAATRRLVDRWAAAHPHRPVLRTTTDRGSGTIYFATPDFPAPSGGIRTIYRHVDILNAAGISASVLHARPGFRCRWFDNSTTVTDATTTALGSADRLVVSELDVDLLRRLPRMPRHVVLNQSGHLTWQRNPIATTAHYLHCPQLAGVVVVSQHSAEMLGHAIPHLKVTRVHHAVDTEHFHDSATPRPPVISYMPRRGRDDAACVLSMLDARGVLRDYDVVALDGMSHPEVAAELRRSRLFLTFTTQEGFGLPALEAMACGAYVVGFDGFGGREFMRPGHSTVVPSGDVLAFAKTVETLLVIDRRDACVLRTRAAAAAASVRENYCETRESADVRRVYGDMLGT